MSYVVNLFKRCKWSQSSQGYYLAFSQVPVHRYLFILLGGQGCVNGQPPLLDWVIVLIASVVLLITEL